MEGVIDFISGSWPLLVAIPIFYLFFIRPQVKKQKEQQSFSDGLEKGQEVVTSSGIIGRINKIDEHDVTLQLENKTFIKVTKASISSEMTQQYKEATTK